MTTSTQKFSEFISNENGEFRMRLGQSEYIQKNGEVFRVSKSGYLFLIESAEHEQKPWISKTFNSERSFQKRKADAILFSKPCFQRDNHYSKNQRIAHRNAKYFN